MELYILRHAIAQERSTPGIKSDFDRPLTPDGEQKLRRVAKAMRNLELSFDLVLASPYMRARETAELVAAAFGIVKRLQLRDSLGADGNPREFIAELMARQPAPQSVLVVGHEPYLSTMATLLLTGALKSCLTLKKAGLCKLSIERLSGGRCAQLEWLLTPRQMLLMS
jgi:phosphohistidine phosphatase